MTNANEQLYRKTTHGSRVRYVPYDPKEDVPIPPPEFSDEDIITLGTTVGTIVLVQLERYIPEHKRNHRKVKAVTDALLDLARGQGKPVDRELAEHWMDVWNETMRRFQNTLVERAESVQ